MSYISYDANERFKPGHGVNKGHFLASLKRLKLANIETLLFYRNLYYKLVIPLLRYGFKYAATSGRLRTLPMVAI